MYVIGLCGGSGSGKGTVANIFASNGFLIFDSDAVYHDITSHSSPCTRELRDAFGDEILLPNGALDRRQLASIVFFDETKAADRRARLNTIAHHHVHLAFEAFCNANPEAKIVLDAPLLFEANMQLLCNTVIAVTAPISQRIARIINRDGITEEMARRRISAQMQDEELAMRCDYTIENAGTIEELKQKTIKIINKINEGIQHE